MATFQDNLNIINTAIYGKEMRPAISEALTQSWDAVKIMTNAVEQLNARIDALPDPGGGGTVDPDNPDTPDTPTTTVFFVVGDTIPCVNGATTSPSAVGYAELF